MIKKFKETCLNQVHMSKSLQKKFNVHHKYPTFYHHQVPYKDKVETYFLI